MNEASLDSHQIPSLEKSLGGMRELVDIWQNGDDLIQVPEVDDSFDTGLCVRTIAEHAIALTESVMLLAEHGMYLQSVPLIRLTLECGITAAWVSVTPNAGKAMNYGYAVQEQKLLRHMLNINVSVSEEKGVQVNAAVEKLAEFDAPASHSHLERSKRFAGGESLYLPYRKLSKVSHAGQSILHQYLHVKHEFADPEKGYAIELSPRYEWVEQAFGSQVVSLILTLTAWDEMTTDRPWSSQIQNLADRFHVVRTIRGI